MKTLVLTGILLISTVGGGSAAGSRVELLTNQEPVGVYAGDARKIPVLFHNPEASWFDQDIRVAMFQTSSATAIPLGMTPWKRLQLLPGQTVMESAALDFPPVKAPTRFLAQWSGTSNQIFGTTEVWVYPTNLLEQLRPLASPGTLGVFDPLNQLKPLLDGSKVEFVDLEKSDLEYFPGRLVIVGPFAFKPQMPGYLANRIKKLARKNVAVVWFQPPRDRAEKLVPSFYSVPGKQTAVTIVAPELVANLAENPQAQLNLIYFCQLALKPEPFILPELSVQP